MRSTHSVFSAYDFHIVAIFVLVLFCHVVHYTRYMSILSKVILRPYLVEGPFE